MLDIVIIYTESSTLELMNESISQTESLKIIANYNDPQACLAEIKTGTIIPDVIFLDFEVESCNGMQLARKILRINEKINVVFLTTKQRYAVEAFELNALDYLIKPINKTRFEKTISRLKNKL